MNESCCNLCFPHNNKKLTFRFLSLSFVYFLSLSSPFRSFLDLSSTFFPFRYLSFPFFTFLLLFSPYFSFHYLSFTLITFVLTLFPLLTFVYPSFLICASIILSLQFSIYKTSLYDSNNHVFKCIYYHASTVIGRHLLILEQTVSYANC